jgi:class 3 adenylate cyclase/tetratricopeptide (TPR) repeat protein
VNPARRAAWLSRLLPQRLARALPPDGRAIAAPFSLQAQVAALVVDIEGFTATTEVYAREGLLGVETLSRRLRSLFTSLEREVLGRGGDVLQHAGDSLLGLWWGDGTASPHDSVRSAVNAARCMLALPHEEAGPPLRLRIGVAHGHVVLSVLGGVEGEWRALPWGPAVQRAHAAAAVRGAQSLWLDARAWALLGEAHEPALKHLRGCVALPVEAPPSRRPAAATANGGRLSAVSSSAASLVPAFVLERLDELEHRDGLELRQVSSVFIRLASSLGGEMKVGELQAAVSLLQRAVVAQDGVLARVGSDDRGVIALAVWGVPGHRHTDDPARALTAAHEAMALLENVGWRVRVGVGTGRALAGLSGGDARCEYTVHGSAVNASAKLCERASAGLRCDSATRAAATTRFEFESEDPGAPGAGWRVGLRVAHAAQTAGMSVRRVVGRAEVLARLREWLGNAAAEHPAAIVLEGGAGIGKSTLVHHLLANNAGPVDGAWLGQAREDRSGSPYHVWQSLLPQILGLGLSPDVSGILQAAQRRLGPNQDLLPWLPVLNDIQPALVAETPMTQQASEAARAKGLRRVLRQILVESFQTKALLVCEDLHWSDAASWELALSLAQSVPGLHLLATSREAADAPSRLAPDLDQRLLRIRLEALEDKDIEALVADAVGADEVDSALVRLVCNATGGHPLFAHDLALLLRDQGRLQVQAKLARLADAGAAGVVPSSVDALILARIDSLPAEERALLRLCSVIGEELPAQLPQPLIRDVPGRLPTNRLDASALPTALAMGLIRQRRRGSEAALSFSHALVREVVYATLPESERRQLHEAMALLLDQTAAGRADAPARAHHWLKAERMQPALDATLQAGALALRQSANREAVHWLGHALGLMGRLEVSGHDPRRARAHRLLGHALANLGAQASAWPHLVRSFVPPSHRFAEGRIRQSFGMVAELLRWTLRRPAPSLRPGRAREEDGILASDTFALIRLSEVAYFNWDGRSMAYAILRAANQALTTSAAVERALTSALLGGLARPLVGSRGARRYVEEGLVLARGLDDPNVLARVVTFAAVIEASDGQWSQALGHCDEAQALARRCTDTRRLDDALVCEAVVHAQTGHFGRAESRLQALRERAEARGDDQTLGWAFLGLAEARLALGDPHPADQLLARADRRISDRLSVINLRGHQAWAHAQAGRNAEAIDCVRASILASAGMPTSFSAYAGLRSCAIALMWLLHRGRRSGTPGEVQHLLSNLSGRVKGFARVFGTARPLRELLSGHESWSAGRSNRALRHWQSALRQATALQMASECRWAAAALQHFEPTAVRGLALAEPSGFPAVQFAGIDWMRRG